MDDNFVGNKTAVKALFPRVAKWMHVHVLGKTFHRRPGYLELAVTLAIMGHHLFTLTRRLQSESPK